MNVLPAAPATPPSVAGRTNRDGGEGAGGFGELLAGVVEEAASAAPADPGASTSEEAVEEETTGGAVAAAVQAAIAAWRADPGDVALGTHLREVLRETVHAASAGAETSELPPGGAGGPHASADTPVVGAVPVAGVVPLAGVGPDVETTVTATGATHSAELAPAPPSVAPAAAPAPAPPASAAPTPPPVDPAAPVPPASPAASTTTTGPAPTSGRVASSDTASAQVTASPTPEVAAEPATRAMVTSDAPEGAVTPGGDVAGRASEAGPTVARAGGSGLPSAAAVDRVLRAVEALEHAPPPRRLAIEVEGVQLSVALQGDEVSVAVRGGGDHLAPGWQRDLAAALRDRGLAFASEGGPGDGHGQPPDRGTPDRSDHPRPESPATRPSRAGHPAEHDGGVRL